MNFAYDVTARFVQGFLAVNFLAGLDGSPMFIGIK